jgi:hypothetical protein
MNISRCFRVELFWVATRVRPNATTAFILFLCEIPLFLCDN